MYTENNDFIEIEYAAQLLKDKLGNEFDENIFQVLKSKFLIIPILFEEKEYIHRKDVILYERLLKLNSNITEDEIIQYGYNGSFLVSRIKLAEGTFLIYSQGDNQSAVPAFVRNIIYKFGDEKEGSCELCQIDLLNITIVTTNLRVRDYVESALYRKFQIDRIKHSNFANSSSYMGSKKKIAGFIVEAMFPYLPDNGTFLDIMCGSGAISNTMAQMGDVWASDAQEFCKLLAKIQGKGLNRDKAEKIVGNIHKHYLKNFSELTKKFSKEIEEEDHIFYMDMNDPEKVLETYEIFIQNFPLYSSTDETSEMIEKVIAQRKQNHNITPYCLFTYYFSNIYFSVIQCIQLDSLRFAIDQIDDEEERQWALGTLVVVTSSIATTYGGHFAQPRKLELKSLDMIVRQRQKSAWLEFSKRILCLAEESSRYPFRVNTVNGPWQMALETISKTVSHGLVVYLDAPYKREEYSRYYHVLETIVKYDYPSSERKGRMRSKKKKERFVTEFFSKSRDKVEACFVTIITEILHKGAVCVWSYSNNGNASLMNVVNQVRLRENCDVFVYGIPYVHQSQGKSSEMKRFRKNVVEYCIVFASTKEG